MGTAELCAWGVPMIVVPLPTAAADHQTANARALEAAGAALYLPQPELGAERLERTLATLVADPARLAALADGARRRARPNAAAEIADRVLALARGGVSRS
jgi:UDP-N-acetylglucosamine--N-acetylmuramyl-(pentapeptide) pyrophosphoryl-undecaprenol N-acetylglucosamine transferase